MELNEIVSMGDKLIKILDTKCWPSMENKISRDFRHLII